MDDDWDRERDAMPDGPYTEIGGMGTFDLRKWQAMVARGAATWGKELAGSQSMPVVGQPMLSVLVAWEAEGGLCECCGRPLGQGVALNVFTINDLRAD